MSISEQEESEFRAEVSAWMAQNKPADPGFLLPQSFMEVGSDQQLDFLREWQHKMWSAGYLGMAWPKEYGGGGVSPIFQSIADSEMRRHLVPIAFNVIGRQHERGHIPLGWHHSSIFQTIWSAEFMEFIPYSMGPATLMTTGHSW